MTAALEGVSGQQHAPAALNTRDRPGTGFTGRWVDFRAGLEVSEDLVSNGIRFRTLQPVVSRYTDRATGPTSSGEYLSQTGTLSSLRQPLGTSVCEEY